MSQYDLGTIDPNTKTGNALAGDLNGWRSALHSLHRGNSRPSYAIAGMIWFDDSASPWQLKIYDGVGTDTTIGTYNPTTKVFTPALTDLQVTGSKLAANTIALAKLARVGTAGQVLTSGGTGADPSYQDLPASYSNEQAQDAAAALLTGGTHTGISFTYDDANAKLNATVTGSATTTTFTASGTWTKPSIGTMAKIELWGGGGSGNGPRSGGGGGAYATLVIPLATLPATVGVTVGAGGASTDGNIGNAGGATSFGVFLSAGGGGGGYWDGDLQHIGGGGGSPTGYFGEVGGAGGINFISHGSPSVYGGGGGGGYGYGGGGSTHAGAGGGTNAAGSAPAGGGGAHQAGYNCPGGRGEARITVF